jgi:cytidine deaminase
VIRSNAESLLAQARQAASAAYAPYSKFRVGAAVSADGAIHNACNVENASYGLTICAERAAIFAAIAAGAKRIDAIALSCIDAPRGSDTGLLMPCGACRQVMAEFGDPDLPVYVDGAGFFTLEQLFAQPFRLKHRM